jgi:hypothetical protein
MTAMTLLLWLLAFLVAGALVYLARLPGNFHIERSIFIAAPPQRVFDKVRDLTTWNEWSPWLLHEPETRRDFGPDPDRPGGWYSWDGKLTGAGKLTHLDFEEPRSIRQKIEFTRPFKSQSAVGWRFEPKDGGTEATWTMDGAMPFFLRFLVPGLTRALGFDYELGLALLRGRLDPAAEAPRIDFVGPQELSGQHCLCLPFSGRFEDLKTVMQEGYPKLFAAARDGNLAVAGAPLAVYDRVDVRRRTTSGVMALPVSAVAAPAGFQLREVAGGRYFKASLRGRYDFLELAWDSLVKHLRMKKLKFASGRPMLEVYENDPTAVASPNDIETSLYVPLR